MKNLSKCQKIISKQQESYWIILTIKNIMNLLVQTYQDKTNTSISQQISFVEK